MLPRAMRRVPVPLVAILCLAAVHSLTWTVLLPAFQGQDEASHFAYTQRTAEKGQVSWTAVSTIPEGNAISTEAGQAEQLSGIAPTTLNVAGRPFTAEIDERRYEREAAKLRPDQRADGNLTSAMRNPPLYYLTEAAVYAPLESLSVFDRLYAMRAVSIVWFLVTVLAAWLLAGEVFGRRRWLQAVAALVVALQPMLGQLGGIVNPDAMIAALWGLALWLSAVIVDRGVTRGRLAGAGVLTVAAVFTHPRAAPLAVALAGALAVRAWPAIARRGRAARTAALAACAGAAVLLVGGGTWYALRGDVTVTKVREFGSYLWQFYLPRPSFMQPTVAPEWGVRDVFVDRLWSGFVQLEVNVAPGILDAISIATMVGAVLVVAVLWLRRDAARSRLPLIGILAGSFLILMWTLHVAAWRDLPIEGDPIITGRYLTPFLPVAGVLVAAVAAVLPRRIGPGAATLVLGLEGLITLSALGTTLVRFYV
jgi:4-amino-4-deoxy-L-arabinose transferase-like glycosyltransferase